MKTTRKVWTAEDDERLRVASADHLPSSLAKMFHVTLSSIRNRCAGLGIRFLNPIPATVTTNPLELRKWLWENRVKPVLVKSGTCMEWTKAHYHGGYGQIRVSNSILLQTHRIAYEATRSVLLTRSQKVCHKCDNPPCCNPDHLFVGSQTDNVHDMMKKGRNGGQFKKGHSSDPLKQIRGETSPASKLTEALVREARAMYVPGKFGYKRLAKLFNVWPRTMHCVITRKTWRHVL